MGCKCSPCHGLREQQHRTNKPGSGWKQTIQLVFNKNMREDQPRARFPGARFKPDYFSDLYLDFTHV